MRTSTAPVKTLAGLGMVTSLAVLCSRPNRSIAVDPAPSASSNVIVTTGITRPSKELKLAFAAPGIVADVAVKEGDAVNEKQVLATQDSQQEQLAYKSLKAEADSTEKVLYSKADRDLKEIVAKRKEDLFKVHGASQSEMEQAQLDLKLATAQIALALLEHVQKGFDADKEKVKIDQMQMNSPIKGIVEKINIGQGEIADPQSRDGAIVVGSWDPLWLEVHLPSAQVAALKKNQVQSLSVKYDDGDWQTANIIYFEKVDAASDTGMVRMELANPNYAHLPGLHMQVRLPENLAASAATNGQ